MNQMYPISRVIAAKLGFISKCRKVGHLMFNKYLLMTNVGISISLSGVGDTLEQHYEMLTDKKQLWDPTRTGRMSISGMTIGILCHHWYQYLDRKLPGRAFKTVVKKVIVDQVVCSPLCISVFFITLGILERSSIREIKNEIKSKAIRLYAAEWVVWPPAQIFNFYCLPLRFRVLYDNTISLGYDVYTSYVKHDSSDNVESDEKEQDSQNQNLLTKFSPSNADEEELFKILYGTSNRGCLN